MKIAAIGADGEMGGGWIARLILSGHDVTLCDLTPGASALSQNLAQAGDAWQRLFQAPLPAPGRIIPAENIADVVAGAEYILVTRAPDSGLIAKIEAAAPETAIIAMLSPGASLASLRATARHPERLLMLRGAAPVYLLPAAEIIGGGAAADRLAVLLTSSGMQPVQIARETDIADALTQTLRGKALELVHDGVATTAQIDAVLCSGPGLLWPVAGLFEDLRRARSGSTQDRDNALIAVLQALKASSAGAGQAILAQENALYARQPVAAPGYPLRLHQVCVPGGWLDYNGHMTEFRYLQVMGDATDAFLIHIGMGPDYRATGRSAYTVETHIRHLAEVHAGELLHVETRLLGHDAKRMRLHHSIQRTDGAEVAEVATGEHMLLHVDTRAGRACPMPAALIAALEALAAHESAPRPDHAGRGIRDISPTVRD